MSETREPYRCTCPPTDDPDVEIEQALACSRREREHDIRGLGSNGVDGEWSWATCSCGWESPKSRAIGRMWRDVADHKADIDIVYQPYD